MNDVDEETSNTILITLEIEELTEEEKSISNHTTIITAIESPTEATKRCNVGSHD